MRFGFVCFYPEEEACQPSQSLSSGKSEEVKMKKQLKRGMKPVVDPLVDSRLEQDRENTSLGP